MSIRFEEQYRGYDLRCDPQPTHDGRFLAFMIISHGVRRVKVDIATTLNRASFGTEESAGNAGLSAALRWVDDRLAHPGVKKTYRQRVLEQSNRELGERRAHMEDFGSPPYAGIERAGELMMSFAQD